MFYIQNMDIFNLFLLPNIVKIIRIGVGAIFCVLIVFFYCSTRGFKNNCICTINTTLHTSLYVCIYIYT
jgi:hypothetical protein